MEERFSDLLIRERQRLREDLESIARQVEELEQLRREYHRELAAIRIYEKTKEGLSPAAVESEQPKPLRRGTVRAEVAEVVRKHGGLSRAELMRRLNTEGDKKAEKSISNALYGLVKANALVKARGRYVHPEA